MKIGWLLIPLAAAATYLVPMKASRDGRVIHSSANGIQLNDPQISIAGEGREWLPGIELTHAADVYDSLDSVAQRLAAEVAELLQDDSSFDRPILIGMRFVDDTLNTNQQLIFKASFERGLQAVNSEYPASESGKVKVITDQLAQSQAVELSIHSDADLAVRQDSELKSLVMHAKLVTASASFELAPMPLTSKPWVQSWNAFRSRHSQSNFWQYRGISMQEAKVALADQLAQQFLGQPSRGRWPWNRSSLSMPTARRIILRELDHSGLIVDQFSQTFLLRLADGSQVPAISRCALLVDQNPPRLAGLFGVLTAAARHQSRDHWIRSCMLGATVLIVGIAYVVLDSLTQGYYVWHLRAICAAIAVIVSQIIT